MLIGKNDADKLKEVYLYCVVADLNNCINIQNCIKYTETGCNGEGKRKACIQWVDDGNCPLNPTSDVIDLVCNQGMQMFIYKKLESVIFAALMSSNIANDVFYDVMETDLIYLLV